MQQDKLVEVSQVVVLDILEAICGEELGGKALVALNRGDIRFCKLEKAPVHPYLQSSNVDSSVIDKMKD